VTISHHVHDELVLAAPSDRADTVAHLLEQAFLHGFTTVFPEAPTNGLVEISQGNTMGRVEDIMMAKRIVWGDQATADTMLKGSASLLLAPKFNFLKLNTGSVKLGDEIRSPTHRMIAIDTPA